MYLEYLRAAFNTCYYCSVTTDHVEELQRKCIKHIRKPLSKSAAVEDKVEVLKAENEGNVPVKDEDGDKATDAPREGQREKRENRVAVSKDRHSGESTFRVALALADVEFR